MWPLAELELLASEGAATGWMCVSAGLQGVLDMYSSDDWLPSRLLTPVGSVGRDTSWKFLADASLTCRQASGQTNAVGYLVLLVGGLQNLAHRLQNLANMSTGVDSRNRQ